jgi:hypothetical protein
MINPQSIAEIDELIAPWIVKKEHINLAIGVVKGCDSAIICKGSIGVRSGILLMPSMVILCLKLVR